MTKNLGVHTFPDPVGHFGFCRQCGIAGGEQVPPSPLGWYLFIFKIWIKELISYCLMFCSFLKISCRSESSLYKLGRNRLEHRLLVPILVNTGQYQTMPCLTILGNTIGLYLSDCSFRYHNSNKWELVVYQLESPQLVPPETIARTNRSHMITGACSVGIILLDQYHVH